MATRNEGGGRGEAPKFFLLLLLLLPRLPHLSGLLAFALRGTLEGLVEEEVVEDVVCFEIGCEEERGRGEEEEGR